MNNFLVLYNASKKKAQEVSVKVCDFLKQKGRLVNCCDLEGYRREKVKYDLVVVVGGDGAYLKGAHFFYKTQIPVVGINSGTLGFLTHVGSKNFTSFFKKIFSFDYQTIAQDLISIKHKKKVYCAINDIVIERGGVSNLINLEIAISGRTIYALRADGVILSTSLGSTAYNLAAGGPIVHPDLNSFILTPICPHSLTVKPLVLPNNCSIKITFNGSTNHKSFVSVDGERKMQLSDNEILLIEKSQYKHHIVREHDYNYFSHLKNKFQFGARA